MKYLALLLIFGFGLSAFGQTIKSLGYNATNGQVVANTGTNVLTFTSSVAMNKAQLPNGTFVDEAQFAAPQFGDALLSFEENRLYQHGLNILEWSTNGAVSFGNAAATRTNLGFSTNLNTLWTATNASNARSAVNVVPAPIFKALTNNFSIANQTNMTVVDGLTIATEAGKNYIFELFPIISSSVAGVSFQMVATNATVYGNWDSISAQSYTITPITNTLNGVTITAARVPVQKFYVVAGTNAGSISLQFSSSVATNTNTIGAGSYMMAQEVTPTP